MKNKNCFKNNYLKKYPEKMNELIKPSLMNAITLFKGNSFAIVHNYFGFIIHKNGMWILIETYLLCLKFL